MMKIDVRQLLISLILFANVHSSASFVSSKSRLAWRDVHYLSEKSVLRRPLHASLLPSPPPPSTRAFKEKVKAQNHVGHLDLVFIPFISAVVAYFGYEESSHALHSFIELVSRRTWESADGGKLAASFLAPSINGPMIACISILFGTLVSTTISNLYGRQDTIRSCIAQEVEEIRFTFQLLERVESTHGDKAKKYLKVYAQDILEGAVLGASIDQYAMKSAKSLKRFVSELDKLIRDNHDPACSLSIPDAILSGALDAVTRINTQRAIRIASMSSTFPVTHYLLLTVLASAICLAFLIETDVDALFFVADTQLRLLWGALVGTLASLAVVCYDLSYPFTGFYKVTGSSDEEILQYLSYAMNDERERAEEMEIDNGPTI